MASAFLSSPAEIVLIDSRTRSGTVTLPLTNAIPYRVVSFKDQYGTFSNSTFTISTQSGESFDDGTTTKVFSNAFSYLNLYSISSKWMVMNATQTVQQTISSLTVNQLVFGTGAGWVQFGPVQASIVSSIQVQTQTGFINNLLIGNQSTINSAQFFGLFGNYNNTVLAEVSTGAGTQELLVFKGSSSSDRVRVQTTGNFVIETGVSARLFTSNTLNTLSNATPAFIVNASSNVGIQTATPGATLDVAGTGRFQLLSTFGLNLSSINGASPLSGTQLVSTTGGLQRQIATSDFISSLNLLSTTGGLQREFNATGSISSANLISTTGGLQREFTTAGFLSSLNLLSTTGGLQREFGTAGFLSTANLVSTTAGLIEVPELTSTTGGLQRQIATSDFISSLNLLSTTGGLQREFGTAGFLSTANLLSTTAGLIEVPELTSTTGGLQRQIATSDFISSLNLLSTTGGLQRQIATSDFISSLNLLSTTGGLQREFNATGSISSANLISTTGGLQREFTTAGFLSSLNLLSTTGGLQREFGTAGFLSTANLLSTTAGLIEVPELLSTTGGLQREFTTAGFLSSLNLLSTTRGLGSIGYLSTIPANTSTTAFFTSSILASTITTSSLQVNSLTIGTGTGWVNLGPLQTVAISSIQDNTNALYANTSYFGTTSTLTALQFYGLFGNFNNTVLAEVSTGGGAQELLVFKGSSSSDRVRVQTTGNFVIETGVSARLFNSNSLATLSNATPAFIINASSNVGIQTATPGATFDVAGTARAVVLSSQQLFVSSINNALILSPDLIVSTTGGITRGYATAGFLSSLNLLSTTGGLQREFGTAGFVSSPNLLSSVTGLGSIGYMSSLSVTSSINAAISSFSSALGQVGGGGGIATIPANLSTFAFFTSSAVISTATIGIMSSLITNASTANITVATTSSVTTNTIQIGTGGGWIFTSPIQTAALSTNTIWADTSYVTTENVTTGIISTITTNSVTLGAGGGWLLTSPIQTSIVSSIYAFANQPFFDTVNIGSVSTMNSLEYYGLFGNYNNTVLAEISTGAGTQELLVFKGSSTSDRVRVQTTGTFVVETGVSARLFNSNTTQTLSNATPAFIINTSSNVGIQTASPAATLDVAGTGRFQSLSSLAIFASSIVAPYVFQPQFFTF